MTDNPETSIQLETLYCAYHPGRETVLRCNRCDKPMCVECAVQTPVGYRCRECVKQQRAVYYNSRPMDVPLGALIALGSGVILGMLAYLLLGMLGFFGLIAALFVGPPVGGLVAEVIRRALQKRRSQTLKWLAPLMFVAGVLLIGFLFFGGLGGILARWTVLVFAGLAASTLYARLL